MKNIWKIIVIIALLIATNANAYDIVVQDEIDCGGVPAIGCYLWRNEEDGIIKIKGSLRGLSLIKVFIHEVGHLHTSSQIPTSEERERIARNYERYIAQELLLIDINKPYIRYANEHNIYEYQTGRLISYNEAVDNNIWNSVQDLPFYNHILFGNEREEIKKLIIK